MTSRSRQKLAEADFFLDKGWRTHEISRHPIYSSVLPDGSTLDAPQNEHLATTIRKLVYWSLRPKAGFDARQVPAVLSGMVILLHWMFLREIHWFQHLTINDLKAFFKDYVKGLDVTIQATPRVHAILRSAELPSGTLASAVFAAANIPYVYVSKVPFASRIVREHLAGCKWKKARAPRPLAKKSSAKHAERLLFFISRLWMHRHDFEDNLSFDPQSLELTNAIVEDGNPRRGTRSIPLTVSAGIITDAIRWVTELGPHLLASRRVLAEARKRSEYIANRERTRQAEILTEQVRQMGYDFRIVPSVAGPGEISIYKATYVHFRGASFVVGASLTGRRWVEVTSLLNTGLTGSDDHGFGITTKIGKRSMLDTTPCPLLAARAFESLTQMNIALGNSSNEFNIWRFPMCREDNHGKTRPFRQFAIQEFAELHGREKYFNGKTPQKWRFSPHQFRRQFACIYFWRWDDPSLLALSYHFRHIDMDMIRSYLNDPEMRKFFQEEGKLFTAEMLRKVVNGQYEAYGIFGKVLARSIERMRATMQVVPERFVETAIKRILEQKKFTLHPTGYGYCASTASASNLRRAKCQQGKSKVINLDRNAPDTRASSEATCSGCHFFMTNESRRKHWTVKLETVQGSLKAAAKNSQMRKSLESQEKVLKSFVMNAFNKAAA